MGSKRKVKCNLTVGKHYNGVFFADEMADYIGSLLTVISRDGHIIKVSENDWNWSEDMFEEFVSEPKMKLRHVNPSNMKEAKKQFEEEHKNAEIEYTKQKLYNMHNDKLEIDRLEKKYAEEIHKKRESWKENYKRLL